MPPCGQHPRLVALKPLALCNLEQAANRYWTPQGNHFDAQLAGHGRNRSPWSRFDCMRFTVDAS
jgi:hypothetical protein